jgi:hypothetical protein
MTPLGEVHDYWNRESCGRRCYAALKHMYLPLS